MGALSRCRGWSGPAKEREIATRPGESMAREGESVARERDSATRDGDSMAREGENTARVHLEVTDAAVPFKALAHLQRKMVEDGGGGWRSEL